MIKFLHTRIRVSNLQATIDFYTKLGFVLSDLKDSPEGNQLAFLDLPGSEHFLELCYSPEFKVEFPEDLMHTCLGVDDVIEYCDKLENDGIEIWPGNWREKFADPANRHMAFVTDPDGYEVEILPNK
jgi:lactoylglutathione lyase